MPKTPETLTRRGKRWGLPAIGLAAVACVAVDSEVGGLVGAAPNLADKPPREAALASSLRLLEGMVNQGRGRVCRRT